MPSYQLVFKSLMEMIRGTYQRPTYKPIYLSFPYNENAIALNQKDFLAKI
jgi:hypothetical protein